MNGFRDQIARAVMAGLGWVDFLATLTERDQG